MALRNISAMDYPKEDPNLINHLISIFKQAVASENINYILRSMEALSHVCKRYSYSSDVAIRSEFARNLLPLFYELANSLLSSIPTSQDACKVVALCLKSFRCVAYSNPTILTIEEFNAWYILTKSCFNVTFSPEMIPSENMASERKNALGSMFLMTHTLKVLRRVGTSWGSLDQWSKKKDKEYPFLEYIYLNHRPDVVKMICNVLVDLLAYKWVLPKHLALMLNHVEKDLGPAHTYELVLPRLPVIFSRIVFPSLYFNKDDEIEFEADALEFVQSDLKAEDMPDVRGAGLKLLVTTCKSRPKESLLNIIEHSKQAIIRLGTDASEDAIRNACGMLLCLKVVSPCFAKKSIKIELEPFIVNHVLPLTKSTVAPIKFRACSCLGVYAKVFVKRGSPPAVMHTVFKHLFELTKDESAIRLSAIISLNPYLEEEHCRELGMEAAKDLVHTIVGLNVDNTSLFNTLETLINDYSEQVMPYSVEIVRALYARFMSLYNKENNDNVDSHEYIAMTGSIVDNISLILDATNEYQDELTQAVAPFIEFFLNTYDDFSDSGLDFVSLFTELTLTPNVFTPGEHPKGLPALHPNVWRFVPLVIRFGIQFKELVSEYAGKLSFIFRNYINSSIEYYATQVCSVTNMNYPQLYLSFCTDILNTSSADTAYLVLSLAITMIEGPAIWGNGVYKSAIGGIYAPLIVMALRWFQQCKVERAQFEALTAARPPPANAEEERERRIQDLHLHRGAALNAESMEYLINFIAVCVYTSPADFFRVIESEKLSEILFEIFREASSEHFCTRFKSVRALSYCTISLVQAVCNGMTLTPEWQQLLTILLGRVVPDLQKGLSLRVLSMTYIMNQDTDEEDDDWDQEETDANVNVNDKLHQLILKVRENGPDEDYNEDNDSDYQDYEDEQSFWSTRRDGFDTKNVVGDLVQVLQTTGETQRASVLSMIPSAFFLEQLLNYENECRQLEVAFKTDQYSDDEIEVLLNTLKAKLAKKAGQ